MSDKPKVLIVNWSWYPTGGDWTYIENLIRLYEENGYTAIPLSTANPRNVDSRYPGYFIPSNNFKALNEKKTVSNVMKVMKGSIVNNDAVKTLQQILKDHPDISIAHLHNIHHYITPAIVPVLKKNNVRVLWSLHDYKILCPDSLFVSGDKICERCKGKNFYQCGIHKCKKDSAGASWLAAFEAYYYYSRKVYKMVDAYLCPSSFLRSKFVEFGFAEDRMHVSNLCYDIPKLDAQLNSLSISKNNLDAGAKKFILYIGRIEKVKGIYTLIQAIQSLPVHLKIAGSGSADEEMRQYVKDNHITNVEFLGFQDKSSIYALTTQAAFVVCPSEWYENFPFSIIESFLMQTPVIGAAIGGIPELVLDGKTGLTFRSGDAADLSDKIARLWNNPEKATAMGVQARKHAEELVNFDTHWQKLNSIIQNLN